ncbi:MAG: PIG-L deacetylase family protein, partial [Acidimicrobiales bacterium]
AEQEEAAAILGAELIWGDFRDGSVPDGPEAVGVIDDAVRRSGADLVYTHAERDSHQDHRVTAQASLAATRRASRVLCYESPTSIGFAPNFFVNVAGLVEPKLDLVRCHISQVMKNGVVDLEAIEAQARFRGFGARARAAEGFEVHRFLLDPAEIGRPVPHPSEAAVEHDEEVHAVSEAMVESLGGETTERGGD